jgi:hypothetical protein
MLPTIQRLALCAVVPLASAAAPWAKGTYGKLAFAEGYGSYSWSYGGTHLASSPASLANCSSITGTTTAGTDPQLGAYEELTLACGESGELAVQYLTALDAFLWIRRPKTLGLPTLWPSLDVSAVANGTKCLSWGEHYFFPGTVGPRIAHTNPKPADLRQCGGGGPLFFFGSPPNGSATAVSEAMALSPLSHFTSNMVRSIVTFRHI